ncbi:MAG: hypothetical protein ACXVGB_00185 [Mycobacteriaceae bacterium]
MTTVRVGDLDVEDAQLIRGTLNSKRLDALSVETRQRVNTLIAFLDLRIEQAIRTVPEDVSALTGTDEPGRAHLIEALERGEREG